jgi:quercetin dioxygenase-like cupin family protein
MSFPKYDVSTLRTTADVEPLDIGTTRCRFVATGPVTQGRFGLFEWNMAANSGGADTHYHTGFSESFFVTGGAIDLFAGDTWVTARAGDFLHVAEGGAHGFKNNGDEPAQMLILFAPGIPREAYFEALADIRNTGRTLSEPEWLELWKEHDQYPC